MRERILIVFIAIAIGLLITTLIYFLYQQTKTVPQNAAPGSGSLTQEKSSPTPAKNSYLKVDTPQNESITDKRQIQVKGSSHSEDTIIVSTNQEDVIAKPSKDGKFSVSITIGTGANLITIRTINPLGKEQTDIRTITYSTEEF